MMIVELPFTSGSAQPEKVGDSKYIVTRQSHSKKTVLSESMIEFQRDQMVAIPLLRACWFTHVDVG